MGSLDDMLLIGLGVSMTLLGMFNVLSLLLFNTGETLSPSLTFMGDTEHVVFDPSLMIFTELETLAWESGTVLITGDTAIVLFSCEGDCITLSFLKLVCRGLGPSLLT